MILWTIQTPEVFNIIRSKGVFHAEKSHIPDGFVCPYEWMIQKMIIRLGPAPKKHATPIWAWFQYRDAKQRKPDLRNSGFLPRGSNGARIEFQVDQANVLLSDFELWHYVLNYWYLPTSLNDMENFDKSKTGSKRASWSNSIPNRIHPKIERSWNRVFDLDWKAPDISLSKDKKSIQATFWELRLSQIKSVDFFISK